VAHELRRALGELRGSWVLEGAPPQCLVDASMLRLTLQEAVTNARKYRYPDTPIVAAARLSRMPAAAAAAAIQDDGGGWQQRSAHPPAHDVALYVTITNLNREGAATLSAEECQRAFEPGYKAHAASHLSDVVEAGPHLSDGLGLDSVARAAAAAGGSARLSTQAESDGTVSTVFHLWLPATTQLLDADVKQLDVEQRHRAMAATPPPINARQAAATTSTTVVAKGGRPQPARTWPPPEAEVARPRPPTKADAPHQQDQQNVPDGPDGAQGLFCLSMDDCSFQRSMHDCLFKEFVHAKTHHSLGATAEEARGPTHAHTRAHSTQASRARARRRAHSSTWRSAGGT
jgi:hypothetical protein